MQSGMPMGNVFQNPLIAGVASQYGQNLMGQGKEMVDQHLGKYSQKLQNLKYYFAVDTKYVVKKVGLLFFPFTHKVSRSFIENMDSFFVSILFKCL